jgi:hypothetical protein
MADPFMDKLFKPVHRINGEVLELVLAGSQLSDLVEHLFRIGAQSKGDSIDVRQPVFRLDEDNARSLAAKRRLPDFAYTI